MGSKPTVLDLERTLRRQYPEVETFPLVRTLAAAAWELQVSQRELVGSLKDPRKTLWYRKGRVYVPPDVYARWRARFINGWRLRK